MKEKEEKKLRIRHKLNRDRKRGRKIYQIKRERGRELKERERYRDI